MSRPKRARIGNKGHTDPEFGLLTFYIQPLLREFLNMDPLAVGYFKGKQMETVQEALAYLRTQKNPVTRNEQDMKQTMIAT